MLIWRTGSARLQSSTLSNQIWQALASNKKYADPIGIKRAYEPGYHLICEIFFPPITVQSIYFSYVYLCWIYIGTLSVFS